MSLVACTIDTKDGGEVIDDASGTDDAGEGGTASEGTVSADGVASDDATTDGSGTSESTEGTGMELTDPCLEWSGGDCPEQCMAVVARPQLAADCALDLSQNLDLCVSRGQPVPEDTRTTFYTTIDGQVVYLLEGQPCVDSYLEAVPDTWSECTGAPEDPPLCSCLCGADGCPYEEEAELLDTCTPESPCGPVVTHGVGEGVTEYDQCILTALRDRTPGVIESLVVGFVGHRSRVYLDGSEEGQFLYAYINDVCGTPLNGAWDPNERCTLKPPSYFDDCLAGAGDVDDCLQGFNWFDDCTPVAAQCP